DSAYLTIRFLHDCAIADDFIQFIGLCQTAFAAPFGRGTGEDMTAGVAELITDRIGAMPAGERRAAHTLIASYPVVGLKTVAEFSQAAGVSSPTILRFVARLGYHNYAEFQSALQDELAAQLQSPASRAGLTQPSRRGKAPATVEATLENIRETR